MLRCLGLGAMVAWLLAIATPVAAGLIRHDRDDSLYTDLAADPRYASVGLVSVVGGLAGSGTLIAPGWVLTCAHVNLEGKPTRFELNGETYEGAEWIPHPRGWQGVSGVFFDLGLIRLETPVTSVVPAVPYRGEAELGAVGTVVGFGASGDGLTGPILPPFTKRAGRNMLDRDSTWGYPTYGGNALEADFDHPDGSTTLMGANDPLELEYLVGAGHSGGGLFIDEGDATYLVGVHSTTSGDYYGSLSRHIRVSAFYDWIAEVLGGDIAPTLPGDFSGDGTVDAADYVVWRNGLGPLYTSEDYATWKTHYGVTTPEGARVAEGIPWASVPEPSALVITLTTLILAATAKRGLPYAQNVATLRVADQYLEGAGEGKHCLDWSNGRFKDTSRDHLGDGPLPVDMQCRLAEGDGMIALQVGIAQGDHLGKAGTIVTCWRGAQELHLAVRELFCHVAIGRAVVRKET